MHKLICREKNTLQKKKKVVMARGHVINSLQMIVTMTQFHLPSHLTYCILSLCQQTRYTSGSYFGMAMHHNPSNVD